MTNLIELQNKLVNDLIAEFSRINPKPSANGSAKRFGFATIDECKNEEEKFIQTILKHNLTMIKVFDKQFKDECKAFTKEFGKLFNLVAGYKYNNSDGKIQHGYEGFIEDNKKTINDSSYNEVYLYIVSKTKRFNGDSGRNYHNNMGYTRFYLDFKREKVEIKLESGKSVRGYKIVGLIYSESDYLYRDKQGIKTATLDEFIQESKKIQQSMVSMSV